MKKNVWKSDSWKQDLMGGIVAAITIIPRAIPYGVLVFAPLGPAYMAVGAFAGMVSLVFCNLGAATARGAALLHNVPQSLPTLMLAAGVRLILGHAGTDPNDPATIALAVELIFFTVFLSGLFQVLFGFIGIGSLAKYIPYTVSAGLMNGGSLAILFNQVRPLTGLGKDIPLYNPTAVISHLSLPTLGVGLLTLALLWRGEVITRRIPSALLGLIAGAALYHLLKFWGFGPALGPTLGAIRGGVPTPEHLVDFLGIVFHGGRLPLVAELIPVALGIAIINSLRALVAVVAVDNLTAERTDSNKELISQGVGNMLSGAFGGISCTGSQSGAIAAYRCGALTAATKVASGLFSLLVLVSFAPLISLLPGAVLSASLVMLSFELLDPWSLKLLRHAFSHRERMEVYMDAAVVLLVTGVTVFIGTVEALAAGIFLAVVHFIYRMGKDILAREYDATKFRSNIIRPADENEFIETEGDRIRILELQGALFFGTADKLAAFIDNLTAQDNGRIRYIILDFSKVSEIDGSGGNLVGQIRKRCKKKGIEVWISSPDQQGVWQRIRAFGVHDLVRGDDLHDSIDAALGCAEDKLLFAAFGLDRNLKEKRLDEVSVLNALRKDELQVISGCLKRVRFARGSVVYRQGEAGDDLFFVLQGRAKVEFTPPGPDAPSVIIAILCPGMVFGEMAVIDGSPRSASIVADGELVCVSLTGGDIASLMATHPEIVKKLYQGFALGLAQRLRITNMVNSELRR